MRGADAEKMSVELMVISASASDVLSDVARLDRKHRVFAKAGSVIVLQVAGKTARVVARGPVGVKTGEISLDSATREKLGVEVGIKASFVIEKAKLLDEFLWAWNATDAMPRVGARLGAISVLLGSLGLGLGVVSLIVTFCQQASPVSGN